MAENTPRSLFDDNSAASLKQLPVVVNSPTPDVSQDKSEWLISEDDSILQVIRDQQGLPLSLTTLKPGHIPNWDLAADAVNSVSRVYKSARNCKARFKNVLLLSKEGNNVRATTNHLFKQDRNASYTTIFRKRCKEIAELAEKRKAQAESVRIQNQQEKVQLTTAQILAQAQLQQGQPQQVSNTGGTGTVVKTGSALSSVVIPISAVTMGSININVSLPQGKSGVQTKGATTITNQQSRQLQLQQQLLNQVKKGSKVTTNLTQLAKRKSGVQTKGATTITNQQSRQLQLQQQLLNQVKKGSKVTTNLTQLAKGKGGVQTKGATTITNQQSRQLQLQQQLLNEVKKGSKVTTNLTQLAKLTTAQILTQAQLQQVQPQQVSITGGTRTVVKTGSAPSSVVIPISAVTMGSVNINVSLPQVVTATPSFPGIQHTVTTLCGEPDVVASSVKAQLRNPPK